MNKWGQNKWGQSKFLLRKNKTLTPFIQKLTPTPFIQRIFCLALCCFALFASNVVHAERIKDLVSIQGVRHNQLVGYGLVVGLDGSGDQTTQTPFTVQSIVSMLQQMGINLPSSNSLQLKNVAAVMVTASLPPFSQPGQTVDVTVSSIGNAKSLRGGTLVMTPLKGADGKIYAIAQGNVSVNIASAPTSGARGQPNHLSVGRISSGATVERPVMTTLGEGNLVHLELNDNNFSNASLVAAAINKRFGANTASAQNGRVIRVRAPSGIDERVSFLAAVENIDVVVTEASAKVILNSRTGSIVVNRNVTVEPCAIAHGNLSVVVTSDEAGAAAEQAEAAAGGAKRGPAVFLVNQSVSLSDVVKALNSLGATPHDLVAILQAMKAAGSLRAELEII
ncbi:MAG: flagellar basal body P-ring protein FlgI [Oxalobacter sp.]|nr:MAG: flagellar basal body P-ring protein FlgI [Oxalobacter sp.]